MNNIDRKVNADRILYEFGLLKRLEMIGEPHIIGSYRMDMMAWNDLDIDIENERVLKEYIDGASIYDLVKSGAMKDSYLLQMKEMATAVYAAGLNIDYFPTNFIVQDDLLFYIDYECNDYMDEWNFENWGVKYWSKTQEFMDYMEKAANGKK